MRAFVRSVFQDFIYVLFPSLCSGCFRLMPGGEQEVCSSCRLALPYLTTPAEQQQLLQKFGGRVLVDYAYAYTYFSKKGLVQRLVHQMKYRGKTGLCYRLGLWFGNELAQRSELYSSADYLIPVPLHQARRRERGYNQSDELARGLSEALGIPVETDLLRRTKFYASQTRKGRQERWQNVETVFRIDQPELVWGRHVVVVDDVLTTGATFEACVAELRRAGAATVGILVLAATR